MVLPIAFALMGKGISDKGRLDEEEAAERADARAWRAEERAALREERAFNKGERARMVKNRDAVAAAAAPVAPADGTVYQPQVDDEGNAMPANPTEGTFTVGGQRFADRAGADAAAAAENAPARRVARMSAALESGGDITGAQALRTNARQEQTAERQGKLADLQLGEAERAALNKRFDDTLAGMPSFDALAQFLSKANGSAAGITLQAQPSADGKKMTLVQVLPDGKTVATQQSFDNSQRGLELAKASLSKSASPGDKLTWLHQLATEQHQAATLAQQASEGDKNRANALRLAQIREAGDNSRAGMKATAPAQLSLKDMRDFEDDVHKRLGPEFDPKNAIDDADRTRITTARNEIAARASGVFRVNGERGNPVTAEVALQALRLAANPAKRLERMGNDGMVYPVVVVNGAPVIVGPGAAPKPAAPAPRAEAPPAGGNPPNGRAGQQGAEAPAPALAAPQSAQGSGTVPFVDFLAKNITTLDGKRLIAQRIQQDLPRLQSMIDADLKVMALPMVSGAVKARLKARVEQAQQEAEMMQTFMAGNVGI